MAYAESESLPSAALSAGGTRERNRMSVEAVRQYLEQYDLAGRVQEFEVSSATVELAVVCQ